MKTLSNKELDVLKEVLICTNKSIESELIKMNIDSEDYNMPEIESQLADIQGVEICVMCGSWNELVDGICCDCEEE